MLTTKKLIDEYIRNHRLKDRDGYHLWVDDTDIKDQIELIHKLLLTDDGLLKVVQDCIQDKIDERIDIIYSEDQYNNGYRPCVDRVNGEITWR